MRRPQFLNATQLVLNGIADDEDTFSTDSYEEDDAGSDSDYDAYDESDYDFIQDADERIYAPSLDDLLEELGKSIMHPVGSSFEQDLQEVLEEFDRKHKLPSIDLVSQTVDMPKLIMSESQSALEVIADEITAAEKELLAMMQEEAAIYNAKIQEEAGVAETGVTITDKIPAMTTVEEISKIIADTSSELPTGASSELPTGASTELPTSAPGPAAAKGRCTIL